MESLRCATEETGDDPPRSGGGPLLQVTGGRNRNSVSESDQSVPARLRSLKEEDQSRLGIGLLVMRATRLAMLSATAAPAKPAAAEDHFHTGEAVHRRALPGRWRRAAASALDEAVLDGEVDQFGVGVQAHRFHRLVFVKLHRAWCSADGRFPGRRRPPLAFPPAKRRRPCGPPANAVEPRGTGPAASARKVADLRCHGRRGWAR